MIEVFWVFNIFLTKINFYIKSKWKLKSDIIIINKQHNQPTILTILYRVFFFFFIPFLHLPFPFTIDNLLSMMNPFFGQCLWYDVHRYSDFFVVALNIIDNNEGNDSNHNSHPYSDFGIFLIYEFGIRIRVFCWKIFHLLSVVVFLFHFYGLKNWGFWICGLIRLLEWQLIFLSSLDNLDVLNLTSNGMSGHGSCFIGKLKWVFCLLLNSMELFSRRLVRTRGT